MVIEIGGNLALALIIGILAHYFSKIFFFSLNDLERIKAMVERAEKKHK